MTTKFGILEKDGIEFGIPTEYQALSSDIFYDASYSNTVKDRIDDFSLGKIFFQYILSSDLVIPSQRSLVVADRIDCSNYNIEIGEKAILGVY